MTAVVEGLAVLVGLAVGMAVLVHLLRRDERELREADEHLAEYLAALPVEVRAEMNGAADAFVARVRSRSTRSSITCPDCGRTSYHPEDVRHGYCGACHRFTSAADRS